MPPRHKNVQFDLKTGHITRVSFEAAHTGGTAGDPFAPVFVDAPAWTSVPNGLKPKDDERLEDDQAPRALAVLTGTNGSGKSQLLAYLDAGIPDDRRTTVLYINEKTDLTQIDSSSRYDALHQLEDGEIDVLVEKVEKSFEDDAEPIDQTIDYFAFLIREKIRITEKPDINIDRKLIEDVARATFTGVIDDLRLKNPLSYLELICIEYERRVQINKSCAQQGFSKILPIHSFYSQKMQPQDSGRLPKLDDLTAFLECIEDDPDLKVSILHQYALSKSGISPIEELETVLRKYEFPYRIAFEFDQRMVTVRGKLTFRRRDGVKIAPSTLSSGEIMMISMMAWLFRAQGLRSVDDKLKKQSIETLKAAEPDSYAADTELALPTALENPLRVILLDEPDRHLDPKLCKLFYRIIQEEFVKRYNIQVIMTSHRLDTVIMAPPESIFLINKTLDGRASIEHTHKLRALFRMSQNLGGLINYHHKVYTESDNDARFYNGAYRSLLALCQTVREKQVSLPSTQKHHWVLNVGQGKYTRRILSGRYRFSFYPVSITESGGGGSCGQVKAAILRDRMGFRKRSYRLRPPAPESMDKEHQLLANPKFHTSYGLIDHDYLREEQHEGDLTKKKLQRSVVVLERYALENYVLDPVTLCSMLPMEDIKEGTEVIQKDLRSYLKASKLIDSEFPTLADLSRIQLLIKLLEDIRTALDKRQYTGLQDNLETFFRQMLAIIWITKTHNQPKKKKKGDAGSTTEKTAKDKLKEAEARIYASIQSKLWYPPQHLICDTPVTFISSVDQTFTVHYPEEFIKIAGHDIEDHFFGGRGITREIADIVYHQGLRYIPLDLANPLFQLNEWIRQEIRPIIKESPVLDALGIELHKFQEKLLELAKDEASRTDFIKEILSTAELTWRAKQDYEQAELDTDHSVAYIQTAKKIHRLEKAIRSQRNKLTKHMKEAQALLETATTQRFTPRQKEIINIHRRYNTEDINNVIKAYTQVRMSGYLEGHSFLLNSSDGDGRWPEVGSEERYHIAITPAIDTVESANPIDFYLNRIIQPAPDPGYADHRRDVFDELRPLLTTGQTCHCKILFPYNITNIHWLTGEIKIRKEGHRYVVELFAHDPYGRGQITEGNLEKLCDAIKLRIEELDSDAEFDFKPHESPYQEARQADAVSCGVIATQELLERATGGRLGTQYPRGAEQLRTQHLKIMKLAYPDPLNRVRKLFIERNTRQLGAGDESGAFAGDLSELIPKLSEGSDEEQKAAQRLIDSQEALAKAQAELEKYFQHTHPKTEYAYREYVQKLGTAYPISIPALLSYAKLENILVNVYPESDSTREPDSNSSELAEAPELALDIWVGTDGIVTRAWTREIAPSTPPDLAAGETNFSTTQLGIFSPLRVPVRRLSLDTTATPRPLPRRRNSAPPIGVIQRFHLLVEGPDAVDATDADSEGELSDEISASSADSAGSPK